MNKTLPHIIRVAVVLLVSLSGLFAQKFGVDLTLSQGIRYQNEWGCFQGGLELSLYYRIPTEQLTYIVGLNVRTIQWGTQSCFSTRISRSFGDKFDIEAELQNGLALFYQKPLYVYALGLSGRMALIKTDNLILGLSLGGRFTHCPGYRHYGSIDRILEIPLGLYVQF